MNQTGRGALRKSTGAGSRGFALPAPWPKVNEDTRLTRALMSR